MTRPVTRSGSALPRGATQVQAIDCIERNHVHHGIAPLQQLHDAFDLIVTVVDAFDQSPLVLDRVTGGPRVALARLHQVLRRDAWCAGQQLLAQRRLRRVQGQGQRGFDAFSGQTLEHAWITYGGKHQALVPDIALSAQKVDGFEHVVQVVGGLAHAHEDNLAYRSTPPRQRHLGHDLGTLDLAQQALSTGHAEGAADRASDLRGNAQATARQEHALDGLPVAKIDQQKLGAVLRGMRGPQANQGVELALQIRQGLTQRLRHEVFDPAAAAVLGPGLCPQAQHPFFVHGSRAQGA